MALVDKLAHELAEAIADKLPEETAKVHEDTSQTVVAVTTLQNTYPSRDMKEKTSPH